MLQSFTIGSVYLSPSNDNPRWLFVYSFFFFFFAPPRWALSAGRTFSTFFFAFLPAPSNALPPRTCISSLALESRDIADSRRVLCFVRPRRARWTFFLPAQLFRSPREHPLLCPFLTPPASFSSLRLDLRLRTAPLFLALFPAPIEHSTWLILSLVLLLELLAQTRAGWHLSQQTLHLDCPRFPAPPELSLTRPRRSARRHGYRDV